MEHKPVSTIAKKVPPTTANRRVTSPKQSKPVKGSDLASEDSRTRPPIHIAPHPSQEEAQLSEEVINAATREVEVVLTDVINLLDTVNFPHKVPYPPQYKEPQCYTKKIVTDDLNRFYKNEKTVLHSTKHDQASLNQWKTRVSAHLRNMVEALPYHLRTKQTSFSAFNPVGILNADARRCFFISGLQLLAHTRIADYQLLRPLPEPAPIKEPKYEEIPEFSKPQQPKIPEKFESIIEQIEKLETGIGPDITNDYSVPKWKKIQYKEQINLLKHLNGKEGFLINKQNYIGFLEQAQFTFENDSLDNRTPGIIKKYFEGKESYAEELIKEKASWESQVKKVKASNAQKKSEYDRKMSKQKETFRKQCEFQALLREVVDCLRKGNAPNSRTVEKLGEFSGVYLLSQYSLSNEKSFTGGTNNLFNAINEFTLPGYSPQHKSAGPKENFQAIKAGKHAAWICGNGHHVWAYVKNSKNFVVELNDSSVHSKGALNTYSVADRHCVEVLL